MHRHKNACKIETMNINKHAYVSITKLKKKMASLNCQPAKYAILQTSTKGGALTTIWPLNISCSLHITQVYFSGCAFCSHCNASHARFSLSLSSNSFLSFYPVYPLRLLFAPLFRMCGKAHSKQRATYAIPWRSTELLRIKISIWKWL